jgi:6,7-dimethyl-8-ribityllumazine synthase
MAQSQHSISLLDTQSLEQLEKAKVAVVHTEWNDKIVREQLNGFESITNRFHVGITDKIAVPGCFEVPFAIKQLWESYENKSDKPEAIVAFGAVIRGGTPHFEYVCKAVTEGILQLNLSLPIPVIFGVLTLDNEDQAWERLGGIHGHKGEEAAITALKMIKNSRAVNSK